MKFKFYCSSWGNISYKREAIVDLDISPEEWCDMTTTQKMQETEEALIEWVNEDLSFDCEIVPDDLERVDDILRERGEL